MTGPSRLRRTGRRLRLLVSLPLALITAVGLASAPALADPATTTADPEASSSARAVVAAMQPSWNLGNSLDAIPNETAWGNPAATKATFDAVRAKGFRSVRIPVTWSNAQATSAPYTIEAKYLARVKEVVGYALSNGLYVVLNVHHDSWQWIKNMATEHDAVLARFNSTWQQIAATFRDDSRRLLFESVNEPQFDNATEPQKYQLMDELNRSFHAIVRQSGGRNANRTLVLPTLASSGDQASADHLVSTMTGLKDSNLVATVHNYGFWPFSVNIAGFTTYNQQSQQDLLDLFTRMRDTFQARGIPVYLGEWALLSYPDYTRPDAVQRGEALKFFEHFQYLARTNGVTTALWDAGSFLHRHTLQWRDPAMMALIQTGWWTRSGTASTDQVFVPKSSSIADQSLTLNPNGLTFLGLIHGSTWLRRGTDYTVSGNQLTLKAAALTRLVGSRPHGVNATLEARFSAGAPWQVKVITNELPVQSDATGTTSGLTIPTQFKGDVLATMESRYADGSNAGPATWTPFQEFNRAFSPDYAGGAITMTTDYLNSLTDGAKVTLKFHFWSGATVTYHLTRSGTTVTGSVS